MAIFPRQILKYWNHDDGIRINLFAVPKSEFLLRKYYLSRKYKHIKIKSRFLFLMQIYASFIWIVAGSTFHENITSLSNLDNFKLYMVFINGFVSGLVLLNILRQHKIKSVDISRGRDNSVVSKSISPTDINFTFLALWILNWYYFVSFTQILNLCTIVFANREHSCNITKFAIIWNK